MNIRLPTQSSSSELLETPPMLPCCLNAQYGIYMSLYKNLFDSRRERSPMTTIRNNLLFKIITRLDQLIDESIIIVPVFVYIKYSQLYTYIFLNI